MKQTSTLDKIANLRIAWGLLGASDSNCSLYYLHYEAYEFPDFLCAVGITK